MYDLMMHALVCGVVAAFPIRLGYVTVTCILMVPVLGEVAQLFMDNRTPSVQDALVGLSAAAAVICFRILYGEIAPVVRRYRRRKRRLGL